MYRRMYTKLINVTVWKIYDQVLVALDKISSNSVMHGFKNHCVSNISNGGKHVLVRLLHWPKSLFGFLAPSYRKSRTNFLASAIFCLLKSGSCDDEETNGKDEY